MKELELLQNRNFREKVRMVAGHIEAMPPTAAASVLATMLQSWTREQWITYHAAIAEDEATLRGFDAERRIDHLRHAIEVAALEYDMGL